MDGVGSFEITLALAVIVGAAFTQGFSGFGYGVVAMAALAFFWPDLERASVMVTMQVLAVCIVLGLLTRREPGSIDWKLVWMLSPGMILGLPFGYRFILHAGSMPVFRAVFGLILMAFSLLGLVRPHFRNPLPALLAPVVGLVSGLISGAISSGGPPLVIYLYSREPDARRAKGTAQALFIVSVLARLVVVQAGARPVSGAMAAAVLVSLPLVAGFTACGHYLSHKTSALTFSRIVYVLIGLAGLMNLLMALGGLG
ncbi:MAG: sulfite exporter TauE/SafE family protein [Lentisphaerae bacterium]|nr:sulfite exporter TauE/SafE family protein [Lentisphaerota bacterium]